MVKTLLKRQVLLPILTITTLLSLTLICVTLIITRSENDETDATYFSTAAVAADVGMCSDIGVKILKKGGTAVDSAVATLFCQGATNIHSSGIGGGLFMVVYVKKLGKAWFYNGREKAPAKATRDMFVNNTRASTQGTVERL
jgi:gamma-glutamyltranspeptidase/glutathione hydrolase/leukotriene-C4 hydrolase